MQPAQQMADTGAVHFDTEIIVLRMLRRQRRERVAIAETNFEHHRRIASEGRGKIDRGFAGLDAKTRKQLLQRLPLGVGHAPFAAHKAADRAERPGVENHDMNS